jgi:hypothetical protein
MKTHDLIALLAADASAVEQHTASRRLALAVAAALPVSVGLLLAGYGLRRDIADVVGAPMFWVKLLVPVCMALAAFVAVQRLARPGVRAGAAWWALAAPAALLWLLAIFVWAGASEPERSAMVWGVSWRICMASIALMALPVFVAAFGVLRGMAPTRPALAGAAAGALAGSVGASVYALHCMELAAPFLAVWYVGGIALTTAAGAALGPRLLRW